MNDLTPVQFTSKLIEYRDLDSAIYQVIYHLEEEIYFYLDKEDDRSSVTLKIKSSDERLKDIPEKTLTQIYKLELKECIDVKDIRRVDSRLEIYLSIDIDNLYRYIRDKKKDRDTAFKLIIDEDKNDQICLMGWPLGPNLKYPIFKSNSAKALKDIFCGLINHSESELKHFSSPNSHYNPFHFSSYEFDTFMDKSRGKWHDLSNEKQQKIRDLYLPKEISEQCNTLFKKLYKFFIQRSDRGDQILFKLYMSNKEFEELHNETEEMDKKQELMNAFSEASTLWYK